MQVAVFRVNTREFGIPIEYMQTILKAGAVFSVPMSSPEKLGLINFQGEILTVFHPGILFDNKKLEPNVENVILILKLNNDLENWNIGIFVDRIVDIITINNEQIFDLPEDVPINKDFVQKTIRYLDKNIWLLNLDKMFTLDELELLDV
ncbi:MAG: chemotaxis protein CheW [Bacteroidales bacterium]|nr:chemotaxis protein CheW [Bacteroidales bacterium]